MSLLHIGGSSGTSVVPAEGVDFDGVNDYLSRSTDLVGNVDSKTFTFSAWVYIDSNGALSLYSSGDIGTINNLIRFECYDKGIQFVAYTSTGSYVFNISSYSIPNTVNRFVHVLLSMDMTNQSACKLYMNDINYPINFSDGFNNTSIIFSGRTKYYIGKRAFDGVVMKKSRLSHLYLDYTYRDLSVEANRRIFTVDV